MILPLFAVCSTSCSEGLGVCLGGEVKCTRRNGGGSRRH